MAKTQKTKRNLAGLPLSERELQVVELTAQGFFYGGIANELQLSETTVKFHITNAMAKLSANHRAHLVALAFAEGLLKVA